MEIIHIRNFTAIPCGKNRKLRYNNKYMSLAYLYWWYRVWPIKLHEQTFSVQTNERMHVFKAQCNG